LFVVVPLCLFVTLFVYNVELQDYKIIGKQLHVLIGSCLETMPLNVGLNWCKIEYMYTTEWWWKGVGVSGGRAD